ncbi:hypothetical protein KEM52_005230 [Ascosphaera acerosa]|nr:hypothetical protein KEM52_005230 [Ascosphaera acerosa]
MLCGGVTSREEDTGASISASRRQDSRERLSEAGKCHSELFHDLEQSSRLADIAYCVPAPGISKPFNCLSRCDEFDDFHLIKTWNTGQMLSDSAGYLAVAPGQRRVLLSFRGTYSLANIVADLSVAPQKYTPWNQDGDSCDEPRCENCTVHGGFLKSWQAGRDAFLDELQETLHRWPDYQLTIIGHSLGGAVATLAGVECALRGWAPHVITFGQPRVGNDEFSKFVDEVFQLQGTPDVVDSRGSPSFRRVTRVDDPIPLLPPSEWGYVPHAGEIYITSDRLPVLQSDLQLCEGRNDTNCSAGQEHKRQGRSQGGSAGHLAAQQDLLLSILPEGSDNDADDGDAAAAAEQLDGMKAFVRIPARYRLWELFFAHRDYFHRLGLCVSHPDGHIRPYER